MIPTLLVAMAAILAVAAVGVSLFSVWRSQMMLLAVDERARTGREECEAALQGLRDTIDGLTAQMRDLERAAAAAPQSGTARAGLNLSKRSQALRMHRKGDPPDQIAASLGVAVQEVDLLIKVHRIVLSNL